NVWRGMRTDSEGGALQKEMAKLVQEGRKPWSRDKMRALITRLDQTLLHRWTQFNRAGIAIGVGVARAAGVTAAPHPCWLGGRCRGETNGPIGIFHRATGSRSKRG